MGSIVPILIAVLTVPAYIRLIGEARYGLLSLVWIAFGYFGVFDLGLSRATAYRLSALRERPLFELTAVFYTACSLNIVLGLTAALLFYALSAPFAEHFGKDPNMRLELQHALPWIAWFFPIGLLGGIFTGCLQAEERFLDLNLQQSVGSILLQCLPLAFFYYGQQDLEATIVGAIAARVINVAWLGAVCLRWARPAGRPKIHGHRIKELFSYGGWITFSDMIGPLLNGLDQMIIGATLGPRATAHYSVPFSMASKALIIPASLNRAIFPRMAGISDKLAREMSGKSLAAVASVMALVCVPAIILSQPVLSFWIGSDFAQESHLCASILLVGMWINSIAYVPFTFLQAQGRPDLVAKLHAIELIPFIAVLLVLMAIFGLPGAASAWCVRIAFDLVLQAKCAGFAWADGMPAVIPGLAVFSSLLVVPFGPGLLSGLAWSIAVGGCLAFWVFRRSDLSSYVNWKAG